MRYSSAGELGNHSFGQQYSLPVRRALAQPGIPRATFYWWYGRYLARGAGALEDSQSVPRRVWNKLHATVAAAVVVLALQ
jgi:putative transposase